MIMPFQSSSSHNDCGFALAPDPHLTPSSGSWGEIKNEFVDAQSSIIISQDLLDTRLE